MVRRIFQTATDIPRGAFEFATHLLTTNDIEKITPQGDGHPVILIPGFMTDKRYMVVMNEIITAKGYPVHDWGAGINWGLGSDRRQKLKETLEETFEASGGQRATVGGFSLGGFLARELHREFPHLVRDSFAMGSPFANVNHPSSIVRLGRELHNVINPDTAHFLTDAELSARFTTPPPGPTTAIFTVEDGIVHWRTARNPKAPQAENIEVRGSHTGLPFNPAVIVAVLDRLAQKPESWMPLKPLNYYPAVQYLHTVFDDTLPENPHWTPKGSKSKPMFKLGT